MKQTLFILVLALTGCPFINTPPNGSKCPPGDINSQSPSSEIDGTCLKAQENLLKLGCKDKEGRLLGGPNKKGEPFSSICSNAIRNKINLRPVCMSIATNCSEIDKCPC